MWSSSGSNTHLLEIRYDLVQHLEYGGQIRADGKHPKIKNTPTITPDRSPSRILRMLQHVLPFPTSNRVGEFSPPSPSPEKLAAEKQARVPSDQFTKRKKYFFALKRKKVSISFFPFTFIFPSEFWTLFLHSRISRRIVVSAFGKKFLSNYLIYILIARQRNDWIGLITNEIHERSAASRLFSNEWRVESPLVNGLLNKNTDNRKYR